MKVIINELKYDPKKADASLKHEFTPDLPWNLELPEDERVSVVLKYLKSGETTSFYTFRKDEDGEKGAGYFDYRSMIKKKVIEIKNLNINGHDIKTADELLNFPSNSYTDSLVSSIGTHLVMAGTITEEEEKN